MTRWRSLSPDRRRTRPCRFFPVSSEPWRVSHHLGIVQTDRGRRIEVGRDVPVPAATVWRVFTDVGLWHEWGPPVTDVDYPDRTISADTAGRVQAFGFLWVPFRIEVVEDMLWTWTVRGHAPPADGHRVDDLGEGTCRAVLELPLWAPWYLPLCLAALRNVARVARREHAEAGREGNGRSGTEHDGTEHAGDERTSRSSD